MDNDGLSDGWELANPAGGFDPLVANNAYADTDRDGLQLFEEIQLGTNPNVPDAAPVYPSEDPDDYVPLTLLLGAKGKLPDLASVSPNCSTCHSAGLRVGAHTRSTPRTSRDIQGSSQEHLLRFLRGSNYSVRVLDNPTAKVLPSSQTNSTLHLYTAKYTAQFLTGAGGAYTFATDTNQLLGTNRPMVLEALSRQATLYVPDLLIAADADRDGIVNTTNRVDRTEAQRPFTFWINDDVDVGNDDTAGDEEPGISPTPINSATAVIDNLRDLEDFARLHFRVEGLPGQFLTNVNLRTRIYLTNLAGTPSLRLFRAAEANGGAAYLANVTTANAQVAKNASGVLTNGTPLNLSGTNWTAVTSNRFFLPFIFEGISTGRCVIVFALATNNGPDIALSRPFHLNLLRVTSLYEHWTVGDNTTTEWNQIANAVRTPDSAAFTAPRTTEELNYILFVHGWRMLPAERRAFAGTGFKRLWQLGYRGRFGLFSWPTDYTTLTFWDFTELANLQNYDRSEQRAWKSGTPLHRLLSDLNGVYQNRVRVMGHSMGNIVASEALRLRNPAQPPFVHAYAASQAASVAHAYDAVNPQVVRNDFTPLMSTPEMYAAYPRVNGVTNAFFTGMRNAVTIDPVTLTRRSVNFHNEVDFALNSGVSWPLNQLTKPDLGWHSLLPVTTKQYSFWRGATTRLYLSETNLDQTYEIYAHIAEARSKALGCSEDPTHIVRGEIGSAVNLNVAPFNYQNGTHEHSGQFNSINMNRRSYWWQLLTTFSLTNGLPQP